MTDYICKAWRSRLKSISTHSYRYGVKSQSNKIEWNPGICYQHWILHPESNWKIPVFGPNMINFSLIHSSCPKHKLLSPCFLEDLKRREGPSAWEQMHLGRKAIQRGAYPEPALFPHSRSFKKSQNHIWGLERKHHVSTSILQITMTKC